MLPVAPHRRRDPHPDGRFVLVERPAHRGPQVVVLVVEQVEPALRLVTEQVGPASSATARYVIAWRRSQSTRSPASVRRSRAYSRRSTCRPKRGSPCSVGVTRTRLLSASDSSPSTTPMASDRSGSTTASAASARPPAVEHARRRKIARSASSSRSWLQATAPRRVRWRSGRSRAPPSSRSRLDSRRSRIAAGPTTASGRPPARSPAGAPRAGHDVADQWQVRSSSSAPARRARARSRNSSTPSAPPAVGPRTPARQRPAGSRGSSR